MIKNKYLLTVSIPTFNRTEELDKKLKNLRNQTFKNFVINIGDNCGTNYDEINYIIKKYSDILNINYIRNKKNFGHIKNFIKLLKICNTKYHVWAADDDHFSDSYLEVLVNLAESEARKGKNIVLCIPSTILIHRGKIVKTIKHEEEKLCNLKHFILLGFPFSKKYPSYFWKNGIYGLFETQTLKSVVNHLGAWVSERDLLMCCLSRGTFITTKKVFIEKNIADKNFNLDKDDPFYKHLKFRFTKKWMLEIFKVIQFKRFKFIFIVMSIMFFSFFKIKNILKLAK